MPPDVPWMQLGVALDGAGWHPAAWRAEGARPDELFTAGYWVDLVATADRGGLDYACIDDSLAIQSARWRGADDRIDQVRGRLDALLIAARVAPTTTRIGLIPTVTTTHTEPFHLSKAVATLDWVAQGRAGVQLRISSTVAEAEAFGRRAVPDLRGVDPSDPAVVAATADLFDEAADVAEVMRRLWDSWEDDAEIRDAATGRFVDRDKLHYVDFAGRWFGVKGPSITPRPPQGQPVVGALAHVAPAYRLAARQADIVWVTPHDAASAVSVVAEVRAAEAAAGRAGAYAGAYGNGSDGGARRDGSASDTSTAAVSTPPAAPLRIHADLVVFVDDEPGAAAARLAHLDELDGRTLRSDAAILAGTPAEVADVLGAWMAAGPAGAGLSGFRLRPGTAPHDLEVIVRSLVPELRRRGAFPPSPEPGSLRGRLGLARPANRYATAGSRP
jgi:alkanesulfonate monooxygenase SsuD/methylene tetrahydromethanopterin reductase-like flavin-dependent oxidoreductase (luciferase family)